MESENSTRFAANAQLQSRQLPLEIDLNEAPLPSPRETLAGDGGVPEEAGDGSSSDEAEVDVQLFCCECRGMFHIPYSETEGRQGEWRCSECVRRNGSERSRSGGVGLLDINATPPREEDVEEEGFSMDVESLGRRDLEQDRVRNGGKIQAVRDTSFVGHSFTAPVTYSNMLCLENGLNFRKASSSVTRAAKLGLQVPLQNRLNFESSSKETNLSSTLEGRLWASHCTPLKILSQSPNEVYLQALREFISEKKGVLGDGWHVEFDYCQSICKTFAVYYAPDGSKFESMYDVARHLGLLTNCRSLKTEDRGYEFALGQKGSHVNRRRKENPRYLRSNNYRESKNTSGSSLGSGFPPRIDIMATEAGKFNNSRSAMELDPVENGGGGSEYFNDGFPVQFEDFLIISIGKVDPRPSYHSTCQIWPVGYRASWHDKITGSLFVCEVLHGGDSGPIFKVKRCPCTTQSIPDGSTVISRPNFSLSNGKDKVEKDDSALFEVVDDESTSIQMMLAEHSPPDLDSDILSCSRKIINEDFDFQKVKSDFLPQRSGYIISDNLGQGDSIGEFSVEGRSPSSVWEMVSHTLLQACHEAYKQAGVLQFFCKHDAEGRNIKAMDTSDSLSKFCFMAGSISIPYLVQSDKEFDNCCQMLVKWLQPDRFGLDVEFVQELIEQLPGVNACSGYKFLNKRSHGSTLQTVGSGFLRAKKKSDVQEEKESNNFIRSCKRPRKQVVEDSEMKDCCPLGKPLSSKLPAYLIGDVLQVWEFSQRFSEVLGLEKHFSFQELECEFINPWLDSLNPQGKPANGIQDIKDVTSCKSNKINDHSLFPSSATASTVPSENHCAHITMEPESTGKVAHVKLAFYTHSRCTGVVLTEAHSSLLKVLVGELLLKVAAYVDPNFDAGESKSRRGRKKDVDNSVNAKKTKLDMLPLNELTWPELARRYVLAVLSMEGNLDSTEITFRESGRVFHCLQGDGGTLCGSHTGVAAMEADALFLTEATKRIFGSVKNNNDIYSMDRKESDTVAASKVIEVNDSELPEWAQVLEPVRKLPTNVGARIRKCVHEALARNPPEWAKKVLEHSISKEVYKGNASGPTKRAVVSVLTDVSHELLQKPEKKEKGKNVITVSDAIMKQCRVVLRNVAAADEERVFCNLLGRTLLNPNDNDEEGLLGYPAMVSRPLDFRTIDMRLAAGAYGGSHEAFIEDVQEVWHNIRTAYWDQSDLIDLAETLSQKFEVLYEKEVLTLVHKTLECADPNGLSEEAKKDIDDMLAHASESSLPKAPWDDGVCKVCGMDKDDDNVLLCDICDSEYHTYCLNPPLVRIPEGNWYCPSCVAGKSLSRGGPCGTRVINRGGKKRERGEFVHNFLEALAKLANTMELKDYWEFSVEERIFLFKFLCDEALNSAVIRDHLDQCASPSVDLQQKQRGLISEWKILIFREEIQAANPAKGRMNVHNGCGEMGSDALASVLSNDDSGTRGAKWQNELPVSTWQQKNDSSGEKAWGNLNPQQDSNRGGCNGLMLSTTQVMPDHISFDTIGTDRAENIPSVQENVLQASKLDGSSLKNEMSCLQNSIATLESELSKVYIRKELLGRDSAGRLYWAFGGPGTCPQVVVNGSVTERQRNSFPCGIQNLWSSGGLDISELSRSEQNIGVYNCSSWTSYQSDAEIEELIGWLRNNNVRDGELGESILRWQRNKPKDPNDAENHSQNSSDDGKTLDSNFLVTKAVTALEKKYSPCLETEANDTLKPQDGNAKITYEGRMYNCECLEPLWPSRHHCFSCHRTFSSSEDLEEHSNSICCTVSPLAESSLVNEDSSKSKKMKRTETSHENSDDITIVRASKPENHDSRSSFDKYQKEPDCPFDFEEIRAKFVTQSSLKELVKDIGLIGTNGNPSFVSIMSPYFSDPALSLLPAIKDEVNPNDGFTDLENQQQQSKKRANVAAHISIGNTTNSAENGIDEGSSKVERLKSKNMSRKDQFPSIKNKSSVLGIGNCLAIRESSLRPLVGRVSGILKRLKKNLLDMDAALPEEALRPSRANSEKRCVWRAFVKSAESVYEMSLATIILEDMIKTQFLRNYWWYWSSPSAAANISTLSALALRIYTLDAAIIYERPSSTAEISNPGSKSDKGSLPNSNPGKTRKSSSPPVPKTGSLDAAENAKAKIRTSKRRKE